jgi:tRNA (guanine-N7-)-methyltransferase
MTDAQKKALDSLSPRYCIPFSTECPSLDLFFPEKRPIIAEIGFGMGTATWQIAISRNEYNYLGLEVHPPGVGKLLMEIEKNSIENLRIIHHDAVEVLESMIPDQTLAGFHVFYPDPWPKKKHHKRRLMRNDVVESMIDKLFQGGYLYFVTDIEEYAQSTKELLDSKSVRIRNIFPDYAHGLDWRPETKFERRAKMNMGKVFELMFIKN